VVRYAYWRGYLSGARFNDLRMVQLMPLPPIISCSSNFPETVYLSGAGLPRLSWKKPLNGCSSSSSIVVVVTELKYNSLFTVLSASTAVMLWFYSSCMGVAVYLPFGAVSYEPC